jgi:hypothetical protein
MTQNAEERVAFYADIHQLYDKDEQVTEFCKKYKREHLKALNSGLASGHKVNRTLMRKWARQCAMLNSRLQEARDMSDRTEIKNVLKQMNRNDEEMREVLRLDDNQ